MFLWNYEDEMRTSKLVDGCGRGGAINDMKFSNDGDRLYAVGHDGHITGVQAVEMCTGYKITYTEGKF